MKKLAERTLGEQKALVSQKWEEIKTSWAENKSADDASKAKAEVDTSEWSVRSLFCNLSLHYVINSIPCTHQVREARELLDEALRELCRVDRGEGGAGQGRADGEGVRRDAGTAPGTADEGALIIQKDVPS